MSWVKIDDTAPDHPKMLGLSDRAQAAWMRSLCWSSKQMTDGFLPMVAVRHVAPRNTTTTTLELVEAGLWEQNGSGYEVHDYLDYQPSAAEVRERRTQRAEAGRRGARARWQKDGES